MLYIVFLLLKADIYTKKKPKTRHLL